MDWRAQQRDFEGSWQHRVAVAVQNGLESWMMAGLVRFKRQTDTSFFALGTLE